ncbi:MAG: hypothetical protein EAY76_01620 [Alphaproteobacteria bacterium]|nr:MAG: hypothetical protein EAY76_01620 [Alphaproteobacteria bacterium]
MLLHAQSNDASVIGAEISATKDGSYAMLHIAAGHDSDALKTQLQQSVPNTNFIHNVSHEDGTHLLILQSSLTPDALKNSLNNAGCTLAEPGAGKEEFHPWKWRGFSSFLGQSLQIASSFSSQTTLADRQSIFGFAILNIAASTINIMFGDQHKEDKHRLNYIKQNINDALTPYVENPNELPDLKCNSLDARKAEMQEPTLQEKLYETARHYSVTVGEVALRTLGSASLVFPVKKLGEAIPLIQKGDFLGAFNAAKNDNPISIQAGIMMLTGKFLSMTAKEPDPYNPQPASILDQFRENVAFKASSIVEFGASSYMMADRMNWVETEERKKNTDSYREQLQKDPNTTPEINGPKLVTIKPLGKNGPEFDRDFLGGAGHGVFNAGYVVRLGAPFGSLEVDMKHVYAYVSDALMHVPEEQLPKVLLATAAGLKDHFSDSNISMIEIYTGIVEDLRNHHQIDIAHLSANNAPITDIPNITIHQVQRQGTAHAQAPALAMAH